MFYTRQVDWSEKRFPYLTKNRSAPMKQTCQRLSSWSRRWNFSAKEKLHCWNIEVPSCVYILKSCAFCRSLAFISSNLFCMGFQFSSCWLYGDNFNISVNVEKFQNMQRQTRWARVIWGRNNQMFTDIKPTRNCMCISFQAWIDVV